MMHSLILLCSMLWAQSPPPQGAPQAQAPPDPAAIHARFKAKATAPETLKKEAAATMGCRADEEGVNSNVFATQSRSAGSTVITGSFASPQVTANPILDAERTPLFVEPGSRKDASAFAASLPSDKPISVADLKGNVVVLFLFNPTCPYTAEALPEIIRLQGLQTNRTFRVIPVSVGTEGWSGLDRYRKANLGVIPAEFKIFRPTGVSGTGISLFPDFRITPTTFILDRQGRVAWRIVGAIRGSLTDKLNHILSEP